MDKREFKELLMLYGADISSWPDGLNDQARILLKAGSESSKELTALVEEEASFEALLSKRSFEEPSDYLAGRIIAFAEESAARESAPVQERGLLGWVFAEFFTPRAAIALALTLVIGFMAGYMTPKLSDPFDQLALEDEMILEETFSSLFMEGDIFE
jgi:hypothetical protein